MAALCGVVKVILSFFRHGEEGAAERHRSRLTVNCDEQQNISIFNKPLCDFLGIKGEAAKYGFGTYELKLYRLEKLRAAVRLETTRSLHKVIGSWSFRTLLPKKETANSTVAGDDLLYYFFHAL